MRSFERNESPSGTGFVLMLYLLGGWKLLIGYRRCYSGCLANRDQSVSAAAAARQPCSKSRDNSPAKHSVDVAINTMNALAVKHTWMSKTKDPE